MTNLINNFLNSFQTNKILVFNHEGGNGIEYIWWDHFGILMSTN